MTGASLRPIAGCATEALYLFYTKIIIYIYLYIYYLLSLLLLNSRFLKIICQNAKSMSKIPMNTTLLIVFLATNKLQPLCSHKAPGKYSWLVLHTSVYCIPPSRSLSPSPRVLTPPSNAHEPINKWWHQKNNSNK